MVDHDGHREPATFDEIRNILRELAESQKETDRRMRETDRQMQETDRRMQETRQLLRQQGHQGMARRSSVRPRITKVAR